MYTPFAYAINKTPYVILYWFSVKITLCMFILCGIGHGRHVLSQCPKQRQSPPGNIKKWLLILGGTTSV